MNTGRVASAALASPWPRLAATIYDLLPLLAIWFVTAAACVLLTRGDLDYHASWYRLTLVLATAGYFVPSWMRGGQTIGMRAWRLRVVRNAGTPVDMRRAALRFLVALISLACLGLGFAWALVDRQRRTWHDLAAGTLVVRLAKGPGLRARDPE